MSITRRATVLGLLAASLVVSGSVHVSPAGAAAASGQVRAWGENWHGQLGDASEQNQRTPVAVPQVTDAIAVAAGFRHTLALRADGTVWVWGSNDEGQLGDGTPNDRLQPKKIPVHAE